MKSFEELKTKYSFPQECPNVPKLSFKKRTYHADDMFLDLLQPEFKLVIEIGVLYGDCTKHIVKYCPYADVIVLDNWSLRFGRRQSVMRKTHPRDAFVRNLWNYRDRVSILDGDSKEGLQELIQYDINPDLLYIDGFHCYDYVFYEIETFYNRFPNAIICGDDYNFDRDEKENTKVHSIEMAVKDFLKEHPECDFTLHDAFSWSVKKRK